MVDEFLIFTRLLLEKHNDTNRWLNIIQLYSSWCFLTLQKHYHNAKSRVTYPDITFNDANVRASTWSGRGSLTFLTSWSSPFCLWPLHNTSRDINAQNHRHFFLLFLPPKNTKNLILSQQHKRPFSTRIIALLSFHSQRFSFFSIISNSR